MVSFQLTQSPKITGNLSTLFLGLNFQCLHFPSVFSFERVFLSRLQYPTWPALLDPTLLGP